METRTDNRTRYRLLIFLFALAAAYQLAFTIGALSWLARGADGVVRPFSVAAGSNRVFDPGYANKDGLRAADQVLKVDGQPYTGATALSRALREKHGGDVLNLTLDDPGGPKILPIHLLGASPIATWLGWAIVIVLYVLTPFSFLLLGFAVAAIRPRDPLAWLLLILMLSFAQFGSNEVHLDTLRSWPGGLRETAMYYHVATGALWSICMLLFAIYFPERLALDRRAPWLKWLLLVPIGTSALLIAAFVVLDSENFRAAARLDPIVSTTVQPIFYLSMASVWCFFFALWAKVRSASSNDARRRLLLLIFGTSIALTPLFLLALWQVSGHRVSEEVVVICAAFLAIFPLTLAYVIVVHRALDVRVFIRQGLQYAFAQRGIRVMQAILTMGVIGAAVSLAADRQRLPQKLTVIGWGGLAIVFMDRGSARLRGWTDRRFFREAHKAELILNELSDTVRTMVETLPLLETVARKIGDSLHVQRIAILVKSGSEYRPEYVLGSDAVVPASLPESSGVITRLKTEDKALRVYFDDPDSWVHAADIAAADREKLRALDAQLLLPLAFKDKLAAVVVLGPKRSEEPYSTSDLRLLESVATQTGLALENSRLTGAIAAEVAQRERLNREIEIAREVQERLFPQSCPAIDGVDYAGHCRPALGVGGDYYDWIELPGGRLGIAIGDVSGKGIPAALLMASLQSCLRSQAMAAPSDLATLMSNMNQLIFATTPSNRYATFFYGQYDPASGNLEYVNGGHNPPMLLRGEEVIRLEEGGPVVGLFRPARYTQGEVGVMPGDVLVLFTDGISEAMNAADEEWDEERLIASVRECSDYPAAEMLNFIMKDADAFVAGAPQHDDMTIIVLKFGETGRVACFTR